MKIPFDIKYRPEIESGKYKVQTRDGRSVRIICWDRKGDDCPIIALLNNTYQEDFYDYFDDGRTTPTLDCGSDLLIITDEPELTPFEKAVCNIYLSCGVAELSFQDKAKELLNIARNEILKDMPKWKKVNWGYGSEQYKVMFTKDERVLYDQLGHKMISIKELEKLSVED